jgi:hypothetical protein
MSLRLVFIPSGVCIPVARVAGVGLALPGEPVGEALGAELADGEGDGTGTGVLGGMLAS